MFEYIKLILEKVSFDQALFLKELSKANKHLSAEEMIELYAWCKDKFGHMKGELINEKKVGELRLKKTDVRNRVWA